MSTRGWRFRRFAMHRFVLTVLTVSFSAAAAIAASGRVPASQPVVLTVSNGGNQMELAVPAGEPQDICPQGCFVTTPDGDRMVVKAGEKLQIVNGHAVVK